ncbi:hypothetical protein AgCh_000581 [Apium graveolens]
MAPKDLIIDGAKLVPNNYAAILDHAEAPSELHFVQDLLAHSEIGYALTQPSVFSGQQVLTFWRTGHFDNGGTHGTPSIVFEVDDSTYVVTPGTIRKALHLPEGCTFSTLEESALKELMASLGYEQSLAKLGQLNGLISERNGASSSTASLKLLGITQPSSSAPTVKPSSSKPKRTKTVPQTPQKRRRIVLRDESDSEEQLLKRLRKMTSTETPKESQPSKRYKKQRAKRPVSDDEEAAAKEGDQESLISQEPESANATASPSTPTQEAATEKANTPFVSPVQKSVSPVDPGTSAEIDTQNLVPNINSSPLSKCPSFLAHGFIADASTTSMILDLLKSKGQDPILLAQSTEFLKVVLLTDGMDTHPYHLNWPKSTVVFDIYPDTISKRAAQKLEAPGSVVGWPPIRSFRKNIASGYAPKLLAGQRKCYLRDQSSDAANAGDTAPNSNADEAGPSGHAPQQIVLKSELIKKFVIREAPVPWNETPAGQEWTKEWNSATCALSAQHLAEHLTKADQMLITDDFKKQLRVTALSTKHLQGVHSTTHADIHKIQEELMKQEQVQKIDKKKFFQPTFDRVAYIEKTQEKQQAQIDDILKNQASQQSQLNEIQASVEFLVSLLLPADAKKGEKVIKSKCKTDKTLKGKDDEKDDQGNPGMGRGQSQGRGFSSRKAEITSHRTSSDAEKRISSATGKRISSDELLDLDEEMSRQLFLQENPGMDLESLMEEEARLKSEKVTSKSKASGKKTLPKLKGIVIKERTNYEATMAKSQPQIDPRSKEDKSKTLLPGFTKAKQTQPLKTAASGFEARVVTGKEARDKTGLGSADERRIQNTTNDPTSLSEPGIGATPERLNQLESVQMVYHTYLKEHILLYFMTDGRVYHIRENAIPLKYFEELEHVLFLLQVNDKITESAANYLKNQIQRHKRLYSVKSDNTYLPKYRDHKGDIVEMKPNTAKIITTFLGYRAVEFNLESDKAYLI